MSTGVLWVCATPIGHLDDRSYRFEQVLRQVQWVACEDTRVTGALLKSIGISVPLVAMEKFSEARKVGQIVDKLLRGESVALVSDAGTPAISDPGYRLVAGAVAAGVTVKPVPGPNAGVALLSVAGISADQYVFAGYLPRKSDAFLTLLRTANALRWPVVSLESPNRILDRLRELAQWDPTAWVAVGKELTKSYETVWRGTVTEVVADLEVATIKGEFSLVIQLSDHFGGNVDQFVTEMKALGLAPHHIREIGQKWAGFSRNDLYERVKK